MDTQIRRGPSSTTCLSLDAASEAPNMVQEGGLSCISAPCLLFAGIEEKQLVSLLACLSAVERSYRKGEYIFLAGDKAVSVGIVLSGAVLVQQEDFWGHRMILDHIGSGGLFAEAFSCVETQPLPVSVAAAESSRVLLIDYRKIVTTCSCACVFHARLIMNMLHILANKTVLLTRKMEHLSKRSTREKLLSFLSAEALLHGNSSVEIPFNRQELADYLCVDRSALSRELGLMQEEGLLQYHKNIFVLRRSG